MRTERQRAGAGRVESAAPQLPAQAGETREFDGTEFVWVPPGEFRMGSTSEEAAPIERPLTQVRISRGFWLGKHEVTQGQWRAVMKTKPSELHGCRRCPVENVSWNNAQDFIRSLNGRAGGNHYRLPTEAEWEYAARAGTSGDRYCGNVDAIAWHLDNSRWRTKPVGEKAPNAWGLYDMLGNVWEWVEDWVGEYPGKSMTDPRGAAWGAGRVCRGGSWIHSARYCRAPARRFFLPDARGSICGFRLLRMEG